MTTPNNSTTTNNDGALTPLVDPLISAIREERVNQRLAQADVALRMGVTGPFVSYIESGTHSPTLLTIRKIINALNCDIALVKRGQPDDNTENTASDDTEHRLLRQIAALIGYKITIEPIDD